jgi:hypothetical protein
MSRTGCSLVYLTHLFGKTGEFFSANISYAGRKHSIIYNSIIYLDIEETLPETGFIPTLFFSSTAPWGSVNIDCGDRIGGQLIRNHITRDSDPAFHESAGTSAHDHLFNYPIAILSGRPSADL